MAVKVKMQPNPKVSAQIKRKNLGQLNAELIELLGSINLLITAAYTSKIGKSRRKEILATVRKAKKKLTTDLELYCLPPDGDCEDPWWLCAKLNKCVLDNCDSEGD